MQRNNISFYFVRAKYSIAACASGGLKLSNVRAATTIVIFNTDEVIFHTNFRIKLPPRILILSEEPTLASQLAQKHLPFVEMEASHRGHEGPPLSPESDYFVPQPHTLFLKIRYTINLQFTTKYPRQSLCLRFSDKNVACVSCPPMRATCR